VIRIVFMGEKTIKIIKARQHNLKGFELEIPRRISLRRPPKEGEWLQQLVGRGNTVAVIEHNLEVIREADYIIDLGPEGGAEEGHICATGNPWEILEQREQSYTARFLRDYLTHDTPDASISPR